MEDDPLAMADAARARRMGKPSLGSLQLATDEHLVAAVRTGSEPAFEELYHRHHGAVLGLCRHMLGSWEEADDAVQHTFMAAFIDMTGSSKPIILRPWLLT